MADLNTTLPDELNRRLEEYLSLSREDKAEFVASALDEKLAKSDEDLTSEKVIASIEASLKDIEADRVMDARTAMRRIAADCGITLDR